MADKQPGRVRRITGALLGGHTDTPPERVLIQVAEHQEMSEIVIGWAQLAGALLFFVLYWLSPQTFTAHMEIEPAPLALLLYVLFVAVRLGLAYRGQLSRFILAVNIVADFALLTGLIILLPKALHAPLAIALKHSAYSYFFVIIALRALRFEPSWILFSGLVASAAWAGLAIAAALSGGPPGVTGDPQIYFSQAVVLPAAEFDRVAALLTLTIILWLAVWRGRALVYTAYTNAAAADELSRFFIPTLADRITSGAAEIESGSAEMRDAAIIFFDLRGFSNLSRKLTPAGLIELLSEYHRVVIPIIRDHGGSVDKFMGDGILVSFGALEPSESYARDALQAAQAVSIAAREWQAKRMAAGDPPVAVGAGIASGAVLFGVIGTEDRLEYTVLGDAVNLAAKLEKHTKVEKVDALTTATTFALAQQQGFTERLEIRPDRQVGGIDDLLSIAVVSA